MLFFFFSSVLKLKVRVRLTLNCFGGQPISLKFALPWLTSVNKSRWMFAVYLRLQSWSKVLGQLRQMTSQAASFKTKTAQARLPPVNVDKNLEEKTIFDNSSRIATFHELFTS